MKWTLPRFRFGLRTLLAVTVLAAIGAWLYTNRPERQRAYRNQVARSRIDPYELSVARDATDASLPQELVAILGDSRLKHWGKGGEVKFLDGEQVASSGYDKVVRVWSAESGEQVHAIDAASFTTSGDRKLLFFGLTDGTMRCWDPATARVLATLGEPRAFRDMALAASNDGGVLVAELFQRDRTREIEIWDVTKARMLHRFRPPKSGGGALAMSHDGRFLTWEDDNQIRLSNCSTGELKQTIGPILDEGDPGSRCAIGQVEFSPDDRKLYVGSAARAVVVFDRDTGKELKRLACSSGSVHSFALQPDEKGIIFGGYSPLTIEWLSSTGGQRPEATHFGAERISTVDWHGNTVAAVRDGAVSLWIPYGVLPRRLVGGETKAIRHLVFHPHGKLLLTGDSEGYVEAWDTVSWRLLNRWSAHLSAIESLGLSADGSRLVTSAGDRTAVIWETATGREMKVIRGVRMPRGVAISPAGTEIVGGVRDRLFGDEFELFDAATGVGIHKAGPIKISILAPPLWSLDRSRLALVDQSQSLLVFDTATWKRLGALGKTPFAQRPISAVWLSDNRRLVTTNWGRDEVHVVEVGKPTPTLTINAGTGRALWVAVHPTEEWIAVCGSEMPVQIWHLPTSKLVKSWQIGPPAGEVRQVAFSPDGHYLATVNGNGTVYVLSLDGVLK